MRICMKMKLGKSIPFKMGRTVIAIGSHAVRSYSDKNDLMIQLGFEPKVVVSDSKWIAGISVKV